MANPTPHSQSSADDELSRTLFILISAGAIAFVAVVLLFVM
jgi:hypothetical protein